MSQEDIFESGMSILFNEPEVAIGDFGEYCECKFNGIPALKLKIADTLPNNSKLFAHHIWKASVLLSKELLKNPTLVKDRVVLELGAGAGIPSIVAMHLGCKQLVASDYPDPDLLLTLKRNIAANARESAEYRVIGHKWGDEFPMDTKFDVILMADTLWMSNEHDNLWLDLDNLLAKDGLVLGVAGLHSGRRIFDLFFSNLKSRGFEIITLNSYLVPIGNGFCEDKEWISTGDLELSDDITERRRYLFKFLLKRLASYYSE